MRVGKGFRGLAVTGLAVVLAGSVAAQDSTTTADSARTTAAPAVEAPVAASPAESTTELLPNTLYYVSGARLIKVEETPVESGLSVDAGSVAKMAVGFGGPKDWVVLPGTTSELPITEPGPRFRMVCERVLALSLRLGAFEVKGEKRRAQANPGKLDVYKKPVKLTVTKVGEGVYEFSAEKPLAPGEYAFTAAYGTPVADFTIVAPTGEDEKD